MTPASVLLIGFAMSTDAFAAAVGKGAAMSRHNLPEALRVGLIFGIIETLTPIVGWLLGQAASEYVEQWDHWIALGLLTALGLHMIYAGIRNGGELPLDIPERHGFWTLALTGFATSIDALAVGIGLAFLDVNILLVALVIGFCTFAMVTIGIMLGRVLGELVGRGAEILGGVILITIGVMIAYDHLTIA